MVVRCSKLGLVSDDGRKSIVVQNKETGLRIHQFIYENSVLHTTTSFPRYGYESSKTRQTKSHKICVYKNLTKWRLFMINLR